MFTVLPSGALDNLDTYFYGSVELRSDVMVVV